MRKFLLTLFVIVLLFSVNSMAAPGDIQVILKSQNLGLDKDYGVFRANITVTMNKIGALTYRESYYNTDYSSGVAGQQTFYRSSSYDVAMNDYTVSFPVTRPGLRSERESWNTIKATVLLDKNVVYEVMMTGQSGIYKSFKNSKMTWTNDSTVAIGNTRPTIEKKVDPFATPNVVASENKSENRIVDEGDGMGKVKQAPTLETFIVIGTIFSVYIFMRKKRI